MSAGLMSQMEALRRSPVPPAVRLRSTELALQAGAAAVHQLIAIVWTIKYLYIQSTTVFVPSSELELPQPLSRK
jgi:hypothetical protein